jgi:lipopolysaccharide biosynthesis protein
MKKILVHAHVFYPEIWAELKACLENIAPNPFDLYVTLVAHNEDLKQEILTFMPSAHVDVIENLGFDVGGFVHVLNQVDLADYSYVIKLHTKRNMLEGARLGRKYNVSGPLWRGYLLSFLKTKDHFNKCLEAFTADPKLGMCAHHCIIRKEKWTKDDLFAFEESGKLLAEMGLEIKLPPVYVSGTMFMARANLFLPLQKKALSVSFFEKPDRLVVTSKAHVLERLFGLLVSAQGYEIRDGFHSVEEIKKLEMNASLRKIREFFYAVRETRSGKRIVKVFNIPVFITRYQ